MNPFKLEGTTPAGKHAHVWVCGTCERTCLDENMALECCAPSTCSVCGAETRRHILRCDACRAESDRKKEQATFDRAQKVRFEDYTGDMLYLPGEDKYVDRDDADALEGVEWAWACEDMPRPRIDMEHALHAALEEHGEDTIDCFYVDSLQAHVDAWMTKACETFRSYTYTEELAVILPGSGLEAGCGDEPSTEEETRHG